MCRVAKQKAVLPAIAPTESIGSKTIRYSLKPLVVLLTPFLKLFSCLLSDNIIWRVLGRTYIYNVSWEDPRIDHRVFGLTEEDHVITLASAGIMGRVCFLRCFEFLLPGEGKTQCFTH